MTNNKFAENEHKLSTKLVNNLSQLKSHPQQIIKGKDKGKEDANTRTTHNVLSKRKLKPSA